MSDGFALQVVCLEGCNRLALFSLFFFFDKRWSKRLPRSDCLICLHQVYMQVHLQSSL